MTAFWVSISSTGSHSKIAFDLLAVKLIDLMAFVRYIQRELIDPALAERVHIFSTFFFNKLNKNPDQNTTAKMNLTAKERKKRLDRKKRERESMDDETYSKM